MNTDYPIKLIAYGVYFGYSTESILEFITDYAKLDEPDYDKDWNQERLNTRVLCNAYHVIATEEMGTDDSVLVNRINEKRFCSIPYPHQESYDDIEFFDEEIKQKAKDPVFQERVFDILGKVLAL